jgi:membrane protein YdbS with pleckstrin-like domain
VVWLTIPLDLVAVGALGGAGWAWVWAARNTASWGYAEAEDDLLVTGGLMFRRLVAVPYGRMQFVDVQAGPIDRAFGIATVTLHTASTETAADIPGLPAEEATRLRNRLTELGESHGAGL